MKTVNIHEAKTHLSKLIDAATKGEPFIIAKAGKPMVKVVPVQATGDSVELLRFVREVQAVAPKAGGPAVTTLASAATILGAFRTASILAALAISAILFLVFRTLRDVALVISALILSALLTALFGKLLGVQLNFANIIALPLLLGVGVSFNVYFVMNWRAGQTHHLQSSTARAVVFSALTTMSRVNGQRFSSNTAAPPTTTRANNVPILIQRDDTLDFFFKTSFLIH